MPNEAHQPDSNAVAGGRWSLGASVVAAVGASICCLGPLVLLALGIGGAWVGTLTVLSPLRPLFVVLALAALGFAFYRVYGPVARQACDAEGACANPRLLRRRRVLVWVAGGLILALLAAPYIAERVLSDAAAGEPPAAGSAETARIVLEIEGMTCASCTTAVRQSLLTLGGVREVRVSYEPPQAVVRYEPERVSPEEMMRATTDIGYPSQPR